MAEHDEEGLLKELTRAAQRRFDRYDLRQGSYKPIPEADIAELQALAYEYTRDEPKLKRGARIERLIDAASKEIKDPAHKQRVRQRLFGVDDDWRALRTAKDLHENYADENPGEKFCNTKTIYERDQQALASLAVAIRNLITTFRRRQERVVYIPRSKVNGRLAQLIDAGEEAQLIVLVGFAGMGKTSTATALTSTEDGSDAPQIRVFDGQIHAPDLAAALEVHRVEVSRTGIDDLREHLARLLSHDNHPPLVILDNLQSADELNRLLPPTGARRSTVVATCRMRGNSPPPDCKFVDVGHMENDEAVRLVRSYLADLPAADIEHLVRHLHGYPLAINYACGILRSYDLPVQQLCRDISAGAIDTFGRAPTNDRETLLSVLYRVLDVITELDPIALEMIRATTFLGLGRCVVVHSNLVWRYIQTNLRPITKLRFLQAVDVLGRTSLAKFVKRDTEDLDLLEFHPLTMQLLQEILLPDISQRLDGLHRLMSSYHREFDGDPIPEHRCIEVCEATSRFMWTFRDWTLEFKESFPTVERVYPGILEVAFLAPSYLSQGEEILKRRWMYMDVILKGWHNIGPNEGPLYGRPPFLGTFPGLTAWNVNVGVASVANAGMIQWELLKRHRQGWRISIIDGSPYQCPAAGLRQRANLIERQRTQLAHN